MPETHKSSEAERVLMTQNLMRHMDELFQLTQVKMAFRMLRDEKSIDKERLDYINEALDEVFNNMFKDIMPKPEPRKKTFIEMTDADFAPAVLADPLLQLFRKEEYIYHITTPKFEEKEHPVEDLLYTIPPNAPTKNRFALLGQIGKNEKLEDAFYAIVDSNPVTTQVAAVDTSGNPTKTVHHGVYRIFCFQCYDFFPFEMNEEDKVDVITCDRCKSVIIEKRQKKLPSPR